MFELFGRLPLLVTAGRVACKARARDVTLETCAGCPALDKLVVRGRQELVYCSRREERALTILAYPR